MYRLITRRSSDSIIDSLNLAGFNRYRKSLFIWEGVTLFLNLDIISEILGRLTEFGPGHRLIFDFIPLELIDDETDYMGNRRLLHLCASINEPLTFGSHPQKIHQLLTQQGYCNVNIAGLPETLKRYTGSDQIEDSYFFASAEVKPKTDSDNGNRKSQLIHTVT